MIRPFRLRDILLVKQLQQIGTPLDIEEEVTQPRNPLWAGLLDKFFFPRAGSSTFLLDQQNDNERILGLAQTRSRPGQLERDVVFMSPKLDMGNGSHAIWQRLLNHLCVKTAEHGGLRIFARLPEQSQELQLVKSVGFAEYCQEEIFRLDPAVQRPPFRPLLVMRPQHSADGWGLQKLYALITPRPIQTSAGLAQGQWDLPHSNWSETGRRYGYVWEVDGEILGALYIRVGNQGVWMRTLLHPDSLDKTEAFAKTALALTKSQRHRPIYFAVRHYEAGWRPVLPKLGFQSVANQTLTVKHMTVQARKAISTSLPVLPETTVVGGQSSVASSQS